MSGENKEKYYIGVDIGGTKTLVIIENAKHEIFKDKISTSSHINEIINYINKVIDELKIRDGVAGMAVGLPGRIDSTRGIVLDVPSLGWSNFDIMSVFKESFSFPIYIDNDVNMAILSEKYRGKYRNSSDMFYISIGTGVGSSFIINNIPVKGFSYEAGEIGYVTEEKDVKDGCRSRAGEFGMLERRISGTALNEKAKNIGLDSVSLFKEYYDGNVEAKKIIEDFKLNLSITIANIISLLNPEVIIIGGGVSTSMHGLLNEIQMLVDELTPIKSNIIISQFGDDSGAIGALEYIKKLII